MVLYGCLLLVPELLEAVYGKIDLQRSIGLGLTVLSCGLPGISLTMFIIYRRLLSLRTLQALSFLLILMTTEYAQ